MIIVTGSDGFIGRNLIKTLQERNPKETIVKVEEHNCWTFLDAFDEQELWSQVKEVYHLGANSDTRETDIRKIYHTNIDFTLELFDKCRFNDIKVKFASSASVYGQLNGEVSPLNYYALSKLTMDYWIQDHIDDFNLIQSFRFFNVYGQGEEDKIVRGCSSPVSLFVKQAKETGVIKIFTGSQNYYRDFVCVDDVISLMIDGRNESGVFDVGTSNPISFQDVAEFVAKKYNAKIETIPFPPALKGKYQSYTKAKEDFEGHEFIDVQSYINALDD